MLRAPRESPSNEPTPVSIDGSRPRRMSTTSRAMDYIGQKRRHSHRVGAADKDRSSDPNFFPLGQVLRHHTSAPGVRGRVAANRLRIAFWSTEK